MEDKPAPRDDTANLSLSVEARLAPRDDAANLPWALIQERFATEKPTEVLPTPEGSKPEKMKVRSVAAGNGRVGLGGSKRVERKECQKLDATTQCDENTTAAGGDYEKLFDGGKKYRAQRALGKLHVTYREIVQQRQVINLPSNERRYVLTTNFVGIVMSA